MWICETFDSPYSPDSYIQVRNNQMRYCDALVHVFRSGSLFFV